VAGLLLLRWRREDVGRQPVRRRILERVAAEPGIHFSALVRHLLLGRGQAEHHLRVLAKAGLVVLRREGGYLCCFPDAAAAQRIQPHLLKAAGSQSLLRALCAQPGARPSRLQEATGLGPGTTYYHLRRLIAAGLIVRSGRSLLPTAAALEAMARLAPLPSDLPGPP
jgi:predicted transcriptional regulator